MLETTLLVIAGVAAPPIVYALGFRAGKARRMGLAWQRLTEVAEEASEVIPPAPDQVALAILQGIHASGKFAENPDAASAAAWNAVAPFYVWRERYAREIAPLFFTPKGNAIPAEPDFEAIRQRMAATQTINLGDNPHATPAYDLGAMPSRAGELRDNGHREPPADRS